MLLYFTFLWFHLSYHISENLTFIVKSNGICQNNTAFLTHENKSQDNRPKKFLPYFYNLIKKVVLRIGKLLI